MKKLFALCALLCLLLCGCAAPDVPDDVPNEKPSDQQQQTPDAKPNLEPAPNPAPTPQHSEFYIAGMAADEVLLYFNEICLDAEISNSGDATLLQKWDGPIYYRLHGSCTDKDRSVLTGFVGWLNTVEGFPGMYEASGDGEANLQIYFCEEKEMASHLGDWAYGLDGGVTFWYDNDVIYEGIICYRTDIDQEIRNSVILEEIYNGLGPVQDTSLRSDSIIYAGYSTPQSLTAMDELLLRLLYRPELVCGMDAQQCEAVIRELYY